MGISKGLNKGLNYPQYGTIEICVKDNFLEGKRREAHKKFTANKQIELCVGPSCHQESPELAGCGSYQKGNDKQPMPMTDNSQLLS